MRAICLAVLLAACAPVAPQRESTPMRASQNLPAPTPADVPVRIDASKNGQTVAVAVGQRFAVELVGIPTAGYVWAPVQTPAFIAAAGEASGNTSSAQSQPGFAGGSHWEMFVFAATAPGQGELALELRRPWESNEPPSDTFRVTIVAR